MEGDKDPLVARAEVLALLIQKYMDPYIGDYLRSVIVSSLGEDGRKYLKLVGEKSQDLILEEMKRERLVQMDQAFQHRLRSLFAPIPSLPQPKEQTGD